MKNLITMAGGLLAGNGMRYLLIGAGALIVTLLTTTMYYRLSLLNTKLELENLVEKQVHMKTYKDDLEKQLVICRTRTQETFNRVCDIKLSALREANDTEHAALRSCQIQLTSYKRRGLTKGCPVVKIEKPVYDEDSNFTEAESLELKDLIDTGMNRINATFESINNRNLTQ